MKLPKPKTIATVVVIVVLLNIAVYYWTRSGGTMMTVGTGGPTGGTTRPRMRAASMGENTSQSGRDIVDPSTGDVIGYDFT